MKIKLFILGLSLGVSILSGCNDELTQVGTGTMPETDGVTVRADTFYMKGKTVLTDSVYARTTYGALGEIYDPLYGNLKSDYLCQFYCPEGFRFRQVPVGGKIDSVEYRILYDSWVGDSLTPMQAQLFGVTEPLARDFYTNIDPSQYSNMQKSLGKQAYTAFDVTVPDSVRYLKDQSGNYVYTPTVKIKMPQELGQRFYDETINNPASFKDQNAFNNFFPGIYVTNTFGTGCIINTVGTEMCIFYKYTIKGSAGQDSIVKTLERFSATTEVIQLNRFKNTDMSHLLEPNDSIAYLKSPAGVYTQLTIPAKEMKEYTEGRILSNFALTLKALPQEDWKWAFPAPANILILPTDSVDTFFKSNSIENNVTSFRGDYAASTRTYSFGNISNMLKNHIEKSPDTDLIVSVIPVERRVGTNNNYMGQASYYTAAINNYLKPSGVKLRIDKESMQIRIVTIKYK